MHSVSLSSQTVSELRSLIDGACQVSQDALSSLPCASAVVVGNGGSSSSPGPELFSHSAGNKILGPASSDDSSTDDIYWLASCTKLVTAIACMQLVEQGSLGLDDAVQVEALCPELRDVKVLRVDGSTAEKQGRITLRMLLTHTAGFAYSFNCPSLEKHRPGHGLEKGGFDEFSGRFADMQQPLVNQPGTAFQYGINMDWAGTLVERATGLKLNDYVHQRIFAPLGIRDLSMFPSEDMKKRLVGIWHRDTNSKLSRREFPLCRPLVADDDDDILHSGGAGLFGSLREFSKILTALLNDGKSPTTGQTILLPQTVRVMFTNQLPDDPDFARRHLPAIKPDLVHPSDELYPMCAPSTPQGWGLGFMVTTGVTGRSASTGHWAGLSNVFWWCDREKGVGGVVGTQVLPFVDPRAAALWVDVESKVYKGLRESG